jgi:hypothetical protein
MEGAVIALAALACPIGMGLMMWFMGKGMRGDRAAHGEKKDSLDELRAEHSRLGEEIERLEERSGRDGAHATGLRQ